MYTQDDVNKAARTTIGRNITHYQELASKVSLDNRLKEQIKTELAYWEGLKDYLESYNHV